MSCALVAWTARAIPPVFIIKEQVVILEPASFVHDKVDKGFLKASMVVFNCDVEDTITLLRERQWILHFLWDIVPFSTTITPGSSVLLKAPWVPHLYEPDSWDFFSDTNDSISMVFSEAFVIASCVCLNDLVIDVMF